MTARSVHEPARPNREATCRPLRGDDDWAQQLELSLTGEDERGTREFAVRRAKAQPRGHRGRARAVVRRVPRRPAGLVDGADPARARGSPGSRRSMTHPDARGRGPGRDAGAPRQPVRVRRARRATTLVMVADPDYLAIRIYRSVGFEDTETQLAALAPTAVARLRRRCCPRRRSRRSRPRRTRTAPGAVCPSLNPARNSASRGSSAPVSRSCRSQTVTTTGAGRSSYGARMPLSGRARVRLLDVVGVQARPVADPDGAVLEVVHGVLVADRLVVDAAVEPRRVVGAAGGRGRGVVDVARRCGRCAGPRTPGRRPGSRDRSAPATARTRLTTTGTRTASASTSTAASTASSTGSRLRCLLGSRVLGILGRLGSRGRGGLGVRRDLGRLGGVRHQLPGVMLKATIMGQP